MTNYKIFSFFVLMASLFLSSCTENVPAYATYFTKISNVSELEVIEDSMRSVAQKNGLNLFRMSQGRNPLTSDEVTYFWLHFHPPKDQNDVLLWLTYFTAGNTIAIVAAGETDRFGFSVDRLDSLIQDVIEELTSIGLTVVPKDVHDPGVGDN